ncbi:MAG: hypothetical protein AAFX56_17060 [Pseudomonadota bacterium]
MADRTRNPWIMLTSIAVAVLTIVFAWYLAEQHKPVDPASQAALDEQMLLATETLQDQLTADIDERQLTLERERAESETGLGLYGLCATWVEFHANHPSESSRANRDRACGEYRQFVASGDIPDREDDPAP